MANRKRYAVGAAAFAAALGGAAVGGVVAQARASLPTVAVTLKEFKVSTATRLRAGKVTLVVVNKGKVPHALKVAGPGVNARTAVLASGKSARLTVTLKDGAYELLCPVGNHASLGMKLTASTGTAATGGTSPPPAPAPTTTGSSDGGYGY